MRIGKSLVAAAALMMAGGSIAAQAETVRSTAPVASESELNGENGVTHLLVIVGVAAAIFAGLELAGDDEPVSA